MSRSARDEVASRRHTQMAELLTRDHEHRAAWQARVLTGFAWQGS